MKKGTYVDINVMMAILSHGSKRQNNLDGIDALIRKACAGCDSACVNAGRRKRELTEEELQQLFA